MQQSDRWLFNALLVLLFWIPIPLGSNRPWAWTIMEIYSFLLLFGWLSLYSRHFNYQYLKPYRPLLIIFLIVQLWVFIQQISIPIEWLSVIDPQKAAYFVSSGSQYGSLSLDRSYTFTQWVIGCSFLAILFLTLVLTRSEQRLKQLAIVIILAGIYQAAYGSLMVLSKTDYLFFENYRWQGIATGTFMYRNHFANFLMLTLSVGIGLMVANLSSARSKSLKRMLENLIKTLFSPKALLRVSLILMVIALVMSRSRMGNTAFFVSMTICSIFALLFMKRKTTGLVVLFSSLLVIDVFIVSSLFGLEKVQERLETTSLEQETRDEVVIDALDLVRDYPLTGTGAGSFYSTFNLVKGPEIRAFYDFAHNDYLQFAIEYGLPMTLLLGVLVLWSLWHAQYAVRERHRGLMKGIGFAAMMAIIGQLIHISVDFTLQPPANAVYFIVILVMAWKARYLPADIRKRPKAI
jgi:O-antigen ligase